MDFNLPSKDEISTAYQQGEAEVLKLFDQIEGQVMALSKILQEQAEAIKELQAKLSKDSSNSGKPPSSDGLAKKKTIPRTKSQRKKGQKPNGGQAGHQGSTLEKSEHPDKTETHSMDGSCTHCGTSLEDEVVSDHEERQVFDIPAIRIEITAHRAEIKVCPLCGETNKASFPDPVTQATQYGNGIKTWMSYFSVQHFIPTARTAQIVEDLVGHRLSEATVLNSCHQLADKVSPVTQIIKEKLKGAEVVNFDETGLRVNGKLHWLHCASTDQLTDYLVHPRRGQEAIDTMGILPNLKGVACHDHWKPYFNYEVRHSLCNAHHLRELTFIEKQYQQAFAPKMADLLIEINSAKKEQSADHFDPETLTAYFSRYDEIVNEGLTANPEKRRDPDQKPKRGRVKQTPAHNLLKRLRDFKRAVLLFMVDFNVPFTNNQAEQDVRMVKVKQKVSGCFRTLTGAEEFAASRGYISTARKNDQNIFQAIRSAFDNRPFIPAF
jgi:transposase